MACDLSGNKPLSKSMLIYSLDDTSDADLYKTPQYYDNACQSLPASLTWISFISLIIDEHHGISNHWQLSSLFNKFFSLMTKENIKGLNYRPFVRVMHQWPVDSPHKGPVMQKAFPCLNIIIFIFLTCSFIKKYSSNQEFPWIMK